MGQEDEWSSLRTKTAYDESKRVMEGQKSDIDDMDDKAIRTVRLTAAILAIGVTGVETIGISETNRFLAGFSIVFFVSSAAFGLIVYNESNILVGPKASYLAEMRTKGSDDGWQSDLLGEMENWISNNQNKVELNGALLSICQVFFMSGVIVGVLAITGASFSDLLDVESLATALFTMVVYFFLVVFLRRQFR